jgi:CheY-like chemotaxis protein
MFLILAIEPDRRQANRLAGIARGPLRNAELVTVETVQAALDVLAHHVPDLVLTSMMLSAKDDAALAERLRELDTAGRQVQTLVIPLFAAPRKSGDGGLLARFTKSDEASAHGCQPAVFAAQVNEYLDDLQLDREARALRQPHSALVPSLNRQPMMTDPNQEVVASASTEKIIAPSPAIESTTPTIDGDSGIDAEPAAAPAPARSATPPSILKEPAPTAAPSVMNPARPTEGPRPAEVRRAESPSHDIEAPRTIEPSRELEAASVQTRTPEPVRLIAPSPVVERRHSAAKPARTESIIKAADDDVQTKPVAEPARMIAPSPVAAPGHIAPRTAAQGAELESPHAAVKPSPSPPTAPAKARPKVAKVKFVGPLHEDPEVARFMAALNELPTEDPEVTKFIAAIDELPTVDIVESGTDGNREGAHVEPPAAAPTLPQSDVVVNPTPLLSQAAALAETIAPRATLTAPTAPSTSKTVKALKPARTRVISPAAAPPPPPLSARKRVTPIHRDTSSPAQPDRAPEAPPADEEPPAATTSTPVKVVGRIKPAVPAAPAAPRTVKPKGSSRRPRPVQDEWGLFDPDQAGLKAVQAALEEIEEPDIFRNVSTPPKPRR